MSKSKNIGTWTETQVVKYARANGFPDAERIVLHGNLDEGDVQLCDGVIVEVKGGAAAENASDAQITAWLVETETERFNRKAWVACLAWKRKGKGAASAGQWWAAMSGEMFVYLAYGSGPWSRCARPPLPAVRMTLAEALALIRDAA